MTDQTCRGYIGNVIPALAGFEVVPYLVRMIAKGAPVPLQELADFASLPVGDVERLLRSQPGTDWNDEGRLVGFGLTLRPTAHRYVVANQNLYAFCATDTLLFTHILGRTAVVESTCLATSTSIKIELTPSAVTSIDPPSVVVSEPRLDTKLLGDVRRNVCDQGHFFASADAASEWASAHPDGAVVTVADAFEQSRRDIEQLGWLPQLTTTK